MGVLNYTTAKINELLKKCENMPSGGTSGKTPVIETGTTTTLAAGDNATSEVVRNGEDLSGNPKYKLNFGIPKGKDGTGGSGGGVADSVDWDNVLYKPSWVQGGTKPTYTAAEVGALPSTTAVPSKTSELYNDSGFIESGNLKTINGNSIVGAGNIEILGSGGGIADAPSDGSSYIRKNGAWVQTDMINVIYVFSGQSSDGTMSQENIDKLKGYIECGKVLYVAMDGINVILSAAVDNSQIILTGVAPYNYSLMNFGWIINLSTRVLTENNSIIPNAESIGSAGLLNGYNKPTAYSAISANDTLNSAIGKLEAGLVNSGGGSNTYMLPSDILSLTNESTPAEILTAFGENGFQEILNAAKDNKFFYMIESVSTLKRTVYPVFLTITIANTLIGMDISVPKKDGRINISISGSTSAPKCSKKELYDNGYPLKMELYSLDSNSSSADISTAVGGEDGMKKIIKTAEYGNKFRINSTGSGIIINADVSCCYSVIGKNGDMTIIFAGMGYYLWGGLGGKLSIDFSKENSTFSASVSNIQFQQ